MSYALDLAVVAVIAVCAAIGYAKGFVRYAIKLLGTITCVILSLVISDMAAPAVYNDIVAPRIERSLERRLEDFDVVSTVRAGLSDKGEDIGLTDEELREALSDSGSLPQAIEKAAVKSGQTAEKAAALKDKADRFFSGEMASDVLEEAGYNNYDKISETLEITSAKAYDAVRAFASGEDNKKGIEYIVYHIIDGPVTTLIRFALFVIFMILLEALLAVVFMIAGVLDHLPAVSGANRAGGLILGAAKGCLYILLAAWIAARIVASEGFVSSGLFENTFLFKYFFKIFFS